MKCLPILSLSFILCFSTHLLANDDSDPILVKLATESSLSPLYFPPITSESTDLSPAYVQQLEKILTFDLNHNGSTIIQNRSAANNALAVGGGFNKMGNPKEWKSQNIFYVVKAKVEGNALTLLMFDVQKQSLKSADQIQLSGDLAKDRRLIHRLADTIHKAFFGTDGIASTRILYTVKNQTSSPKDKSISEIWEADYDGGNARQLTKENSYCMAPIYLPPKPGFVTGGFLYVSYLIGQPKIYSASAKDGLGHRVIKLRGNQLMPAVSLQRDKIAFISDVTGNPDLFLQPFSPETGAIGKPYQIFSAKQATQGSPTFSPDGKRVAFVSNKDGSPKIYVITIPEAGTSLKDVKATLISKRNRENSAPAWSPDGTKIAYCARASDARQIWIYDFTTNQETQVTQGPGNKENPSWAPNNLHLVFNSTEANDTQLYLVNLNQPEATPITSGKNEKRFPNWEPRAKG